MPNSDTPESVIKSVEAKKPRKPRTSRATPAGNMKVTSPDNVVPVAVEPVTHKVPVMNKDGKKIASLTVTNL